MYREKNNADLFFYYYYFFGEVCVVTCCLTFDCNRSQCYLVTIHHLSILQLENLFFFYFRLECVVFFLSLSFCVWKVWEREISIKSFCVGPMALSQSRWTCWLGLSPRLFGRVLMIFLCVCVKKGRRIGVVAYWILWARPKYFGGSFFFLTAVHCSPSPVFSPLSIDP